MEETLKIDTDLHKIKSADGLVIADFAVHDTQIVLLNHCIAIHLQCQSRPHGTKI